MEKKLIMPANYTAIDAQEELTIVGGADMSVYMIRSILEAVAGIFGAFDFSGTFGERDKNSSSIGAGFGNTGASATHEKEKDRRLNWSMDGKQFFYSVVRLIEVFL